MAMANTVTKRGTIQNKGYTAEEWAAANPILAARELGILQGSNPQKFKIGDGVSRWSELQFAGGSGGGTVDLTAVNAAIATKADATQTTAALNQKADLSLLAGKADNLALQQGLAGKANVTDLALKADATAMTTALAAKADGATTTAALAGKADGAATTAALATKADGATTTAALATKMGKTDATQPMEVELVTTRNVGKISTVNGQVTPSTQGADEYSNFAAVTPGEYVLIRYKSRAISESPPVTYAGIAGYSAANFGSFVSKVFDLDTFNLENDTQLLGEVSFIDVLRQVPAGVNFIAGSSNIEGVDGVPISIKAIRNTGTLLQSLTQLYTKVNTKSTIDQNSGTGSGSGAGYQFSAADKAKLDAIQLPTATFVQKGNGYAIQFQDTVNGLNYLGYSQNGNWILEGTTKSLRSMPYLMGFAYDVDKSKPAYDAAVADSTILTAENGTGTGHVQPGLNAGFTTYVPGAGSLKYDFAEGDKVYEKARSIGAKVHGAHLTWHQNNATSAPLKPHFQAWIDANPGNEKWAISTYFEEVIPTVVSHYEGQYPGMTVAWNVMNENIQGDGSQTPNSQFSLYFTRDEFAKMAFTAFFSVAPATCKAYWNDYGFEGGNTSKVNALITAINNLASLGLTSPTGRPIRVEGIGSQMHAVVAIGERGDVPTDYGIETYRDRLAMLAATGLEIRLTELDLMTGAGWDDAMELRQANSFANIVIGYERAVPAAQRGGIIFWTVGDSGYITNVGKGYTILNAPQFPGLFDWNFNAKLAKEKILATQDRPQIFADIYQDFMTVVGSGSDIGGTLTAGLAPATWTKTGYTTGVMSANDIGLRAAQTSQNSPTLVFVDYPYTDRTLIIKLYGLLSETNRYFYGMIKWKDSSNYIAVTTDKTNHVWVVMKNVAGVTQTIISSTALPTEGDELKVTTIGGAITLYVNGVLQGTVADSALQSSTKAGIQLRGYADKFTSIDEITLNKI